MRVIGINEYYKLIWGREDLSDSLIGSVVSYRMGPKTQRSNECVLKFPNVESSSEAARLLGKKVAWPVGERKIRGKIVALHGKRGLVRVRFRRGVSGQALGTRVEIIG